jgi:hypothetical protein
MMQSRGIPSSTVQLFVAGEENPLRSADRAADCMRKAGSTTLFMLQTRGVCASMRALVLPLTA